MLLYIRRRYCERTKCFQIFLGYLRIILNLICFLIWFFHYRKHCLCVTSLCLVTFTVQMPRTLVTEIPKIQDLQDDIVRAENVNILSPQKNNFLWTLLLPVRKVHISFWYGIFLFSIPQEIELTVVYSIEGAFGFFWGKRSSKKKIFICWKWARHDLSCDRFFFFINVIPIGLSFDIYISVVRVSVETTDPTSGNLRVSERNNGVVANFH